jgi:hypothetical protein
MKSTHAGNQAAFAFLLLAAASSQATLVKFNLSPPGADVAVGLSPSNEVPKAVGSTGSGNAISGGIVLDTSTYTLQLAIGYGSAAGFTDLTGPPTAMHIHGPAQPGQNAPTLLDLEPYNFLAQNPAEGGIIFGDIAFPTNLVANLLAGSNYVNIATAAFTNGEIRGQLIPVLNQPPLVSCPAAATTECGTSASVTVVVSDPDGDALQVVWSVNGTPVQTNSVPATNPAAAADVTLSGEFAPGTNVVAVSVSDGSDVASCSTIITVTDTTPPSIDSLTAVPAVLWPPNHQMVSIQLQAVVSDSCGNTTWRIVGVTSNEPSSGPTGPNWVITGDHSLLLRADRAGAGTGRVYTIKVSAQDDAGNSSSKTVTVTVPHDQS